MAVITGYTADRMKNIEDTTVTSGSVNASGNLILAQRGGAQIDAGLVKGPQGIQGSQGIQGTPGVNGVSGGTTSQRDTYFGIPANDGERATLANKAPVWWNVTTNTLETYFAVTGTAGLNVPGVNPPKTAGWYPFPYVDNRPLGLLYRALVPTSTGTVTNAIINNIPSFTFKANRNYRIVWDFSYYASGNSDSLFWCSIQRASTADAASAITGLTPIAGRTKGLITTYALQSTQYTGPLTAYYSPGAADVTTQIKFRVEQVLGDDGLIVIGNANENATYLIYDDGAQI